MADAWPTPHAATARRWMGARAHRLRPRSRGKRLHRKTMPGVASAQNAQGGNCQTKDLRTVNPGSLAWYIQYSCVVEISPGMAHRAEGRSHLRRPPFTREV